MKEALKTIASRIAQTKSLVLTEEATKNAYIMPFIQSVLGYDVFNPLEVVPEFSAAQGVKEPDKVDYALFIDGKPAILIECKPCNSQLNVANEGQLMRYFTATEAKFAILTNGVEYRFYTDLIDPNILDKTPFMSFKLDEDIDKVNITVLSKFKKEGFDPASIRKLAEMMKSTNDVIDALNEELSNPSDDFARIIFKKFNDGPFTQAQCDKYKPIIKNSIDLIISSKVKASLDTALKHTFDEQTEQQDRQNEMVLAQDNNGIITTDEEKEAYMMVRSIGSEITDIDKIVIRDSKTYCMVNFEDNNRKPIIRFWFNNFDKYAAITLFDGEQEDKVQIEKVTDIYQYKSRILATIRKYLNQE